jgi:hypothetical protein
MRTLKAILFGEFKKGIIPNSGTTTTLVPDHIDFNDWAKYCFTEIQKLTK